jgi:hypothetical protein
MEQDLTDFEPTVFPKNDYLTQLKENEKTSEQRFVDQWDGERVIVSEFYDLYRNYCIDKRLKYADTATGFGMKMTTLVRDKKVIKDVKNNEIHYSKPAPCVIITKQ